MRKVIVLGLLALMGCASTDKVLNEPATAIYHSQKSPKEVAFCLGNKNNVSVLERDDGSRVVLLKNGYGGVSLAFSVYPDGSGSKIEYRKKFGTVGGIWKQCIGEQ